MKFGQWLTIPALKFRCWAGGSWGHLHLWGGESRKFLVRMRWQLLPDRLALAQPGKKEIFCWRSAQMWRVCRSWAAFRVGGGEFPLSLKSKESRDVLTQHSEEEERTSFPRWGNEALLFFFFFFKFLFGIWTEPMNDVIVSGGQRRDLATHTHVSLLSQTYFHPGCNATLSRVICTIQ